MPYKSNRQRKFFHYAESNGKMPKATVDEFDEASKGKDLPEHAAMGYYAQGGYVGNPRLSGMGGPSGEYQSGYKKQRAGEYDKPVDVIMGKVGYSGKSMDDMDGEAEHNNSSGEPGTNEFLTPEHPMTYLSDGGMVYKNSQGYGEKESDQDMPAFADGGMVEHYNGEPEPAHDEQEDPAFEDMPTEDKPRLYGSGANMPESYSGKFAKGGSVGKMVGHAFSKALKRHRGYR